MLEGGKKVKGTLSLAICMIKEFLYDAGPEGLPLDLSLTLFVTLGKSLLSGPQLFHVENSIKCAIIF